VSSAELFIAVELIDTGQSESVVLQASQIERSWLKPSHLTSTIETFYDPTRQKVMAMRRSKFCDLVIEETPVPLPPELDASSVLVQASLTISTSRL